MIRSLPLYTLFAAVVAIAAPGCSEDRNAAEVSQAQPAIVNDPSSPPLSGQVSKQATFDLAAVPVSDRPLGAFPFLSLPQGYEEINVKNLNVARVPFWTGDRLEQVEGKAHLATIHAKSGTVFSDFELEKNVEQMVLEAGGVKVTDSIIPPSVIEPVDQGAQLNLVEGWGDVFNNAAQTYVIRHQGATVWIHLCANSAGAGWIVVEERAFEATAKLLPADELKNALDSTGKVSLQINFAVDKADILPDSMPQIEQVANLFKTNLDLKLAINGHTDNTGDVARNRPLSLARADSVAAALIARGIAADRLRTQGFGQDQPVASNADEQGRAQNRRVELIKQ